MLPKLQAHFIQVFTNYKSSAGSLGVTALQAGIQFENGLYVGGTFSAAGLPLTTDNITISGTAGNGYIQYAAQTVAPSLALVHTYADSGGHFAIGASGSTANDISFTNSLMTSNRNYAFQDKTGTLAMVGDNVSEFTNDSGYITSAALTNLVTGPASAVSGNLPSFNGTTGKLIQDSGVPVSSLVLTSRTLTEGAGLAGNTYDLSANRTLAMGTPSTLSIASTNAASGTTHSHLITSSSNPGAATALLSSNGSGYLQLVRLGIGVAPTQPLHVAGNAFIDAATANLYLKDTSTGFQAATTLVVTPQSGNAFRTTGFTSGVSGWNQSNNGDAEFNNVRIRGELAASVFKVSEISATAGTFGVFYSAAALNADCTTPASTSSSFTFDAKNSDASGMLFAVNDVVRFKSWTGAAISDSWATITARTTHTTYTTYTATLNSGSTSATFRAGTAVVDYGPSGTGFITLSADGTVGSSPNLTMATHAGSPWSAQTNLLRLGNLNGSYGYVTNTHGIGIGSGGVSDPYFIATSGSVRFGLGSTDYITFSGTDAQFTNLIKLTGASAAISLGSAPPTSATAGTGIWIDRNSIVALSSNTQNVVLNSAGLNAGVGFVVLDQNGVTFAADAEIGSTRFLQWKTGGTTQVGYLSVRYFDDGTGVINNLSLYYGSIPSGTTNSIGQTMIRADNDIGRNANVSARVTGSAYTSANKSWVEIYGGTGFSGLLVGSSGGAPTHMLEVYGEGYFQSNVAIGTTSTGSVGGDGGTFTNLRVHNSTGYGLLTLSGPGTADGGNGGIISFGSTGAASTDKRFVVINGTSDGNSASTTNGRLDIYTTNAGTSSLTFRLSKTGLLRLPGYGAGTLSTDASGNITASSDEKLKTNIRKFRKGLDTLKKLEPILYRWNKKSGLDRKNDYVGFGARHTKRHIPEAVGKGRDGFHTMSDRVIVATLVNAVKELADRVDALAA